MTTVTKAYTATGNSEVMFVGDKQSYTYTITGSFNATWIIETTRDQTNFTQVATGTATQSAVTVVVNEKTPTGGLWVRSRCDPFSSGTMTVVTEDVADAIADTEIIDAEGLSVFKAVDGGIVKGGTSTTTGASTLTGNVAMAGTLAVTGAVTHTSTTALNDDVTMADGKDIVLNTGTGTSIGTASAQKLSFYGATPVNKGNALTAATSAATFTISGAGDSAFSVVTSGVNFSLQTAAEFQGLLNTVVETKTRMDEMESRIQDTGLIN